MININPITALIMILFIALIFIVSIRKELK